MSSTDGDCVSLQPPAPHEIDFLVREALNMEPGNPTRSPSLTVGRFRFRLLVFPKGTASTKGKEVSAFVEADPPECLSSQWRFPDVKYQITMVNWRDFRQSLTKTDSWTFTKDWIDRGWHDMMHVRDLTNGGWLGPGGAMHFRATAKVELSDQAWAAMLVPEARAQAGLSADLSALWTSAWRCDVTLKAADGQELRAHSLILAARSPVFKRMLASGMTESIAGHIDIPDITLETLQQLCEFLYSGKVEEVIWTSDDATSGLLRAAAKYELPALKQLCEAKAQSRVEVGNVADWLRAAAEVDAEGLRVHCLQFIADQLAEVQATDGWDRLMMDKQLLCEVAPLLFQTIAPANKRRRGPNAGAGPASD